MESQQKSEAAHRLLTAANLHRMRGQMAEAANACRQALEADPEDASAHEMMGDLLQAQGKLQEAMEHFRQAFQKEGRPVTEEKIARLALRIQAATQQDLTGAAAVMGQKPSHPVSPSMAVMLSMFFPGLGQLYNNDQQKGFVLFGVWLMGLLMSMSLMVPHLRTIRRAMLGSGGDYGGPGIPGFFWLLLLVMGAIWVYSIIDASLTATALSQERGQQEIDI